MKILNIKINNILSIQDATIAIDSSGLVLIDGWNYDLNRANGAGKTAIGNAMSFAIYDKIPRNITASDILRRGTKSGFAECTLMLGNDEWVVRRSRPKGVVFTKNGVITDITQEEWEKKLRLSYKQFISSVYCAQSTQSRFLSLNDSDKKNFLLQLLDLDEFSRCKKESDDVIKGLESEIDQVSIKLNTAQSKVEAYSESLIDSEQLGSQILEFNSQIEAILADINKLESVPKPDLTEYAKIEETIRDRENKITSAKSKRSVLHDQYRRLSLKVKDFDGSTTCKSCGSTLDNTKAKHSHETDQVDIQNQLKDIKISIDECDAVIIVEAQIKGLKEKLYTKRNLNTRDYDSAQNRIQELSQSINKKQNLAKNLHEKLLLDVDLRSKIDSLGTIITKLGNLIVNKKHEVEFYKTISNLCSPTGAQAYVLDSVIESFNSNIANYITLLWPNATYTLNSYKENSTGEVVAKFSQTLCIDGEAVSIGSLSGGELKAISLCADFAILDILQSRFGIDINPIILDEPFDGLDVVGREIVIDLLGKIAKDRQIMVIDHNSEAKAMFSKTIFVEKKNKISTVSVES